MKLRLSLLLFMFTCSPAANASSSVLKQSMGSFINNEGIDHLQTKNYAVAQQKFLSALIYSRNDLTTRMNIAFTFELMGDREKAMQEYLSIVNDPAFAENPDLFYAYFNLAKAMGDAKKIDQALENYQKALSFRPDSIEVKTNIELLIQDGGGGGGGGENQDQQNQQDPQQDQQNQQPQDQQQEQKPKKNPEDLNEQDMQKIFEELKNQEQKIRELEYGEGTKKDPNGKDW